MKEKFCSATLVTLIVIGCLRFFVWDDLALKIRAQRYLKTTGTIHSSTVGIHERPKGGKTYYPVVDYRYEVDGQKYHGDKVSIVEPSLEIGAANQAVSRYAVGTQLPVFYDPHAPEVSLLEQGLSGDDVRPLAIAFPFVVMALGLWARFLVCVLQPRRGLSEVGTRKVVALGWHCPPVQSAIVMSLLGLLSLFIFGLAPHMEIWVYASLIAFLCSCGAVTWFITQRGNTSKDAELILDPAQRTLSFQPEDGGARLGRTTLSYDEVRSVVVETGGEGKGAFSFLALRTDGREFCLMRRESIMDATQYIEHVRQFLNRELELQTFNKSEP